jgi:hypothetical protein
MLETRYTRSKLLFSIAALVVTVGGMSLRAAVPTAPSNLSVTVNGLFVTLSWSPSGNSPTQYILQAGFAPGQTAITVPIDASQTTFSASAAPGTYYARVVAVNADGTSAPSNEITVVLAGGGCSVPSPPLNLRAIIRGTEAFVFWARPAVGNVSNYVLQAGTAPGQTFTQFVTTGTTLNANVPNGTYFLRVIATSPCGNSAASNEIVVSFPSNTVRVADPDPGTTLGLPDIAGLIARIHAENPGLINLSCPTGRKYENNPWQDRMVDRLRQYDTRFGYNGKPTRSAVDNNGFPVIAAGDEITFFAGGGVAQGSRAVYAIDILFGHCGPTPELTFRNFTGEEEAFWTGAGRFAGDEPQ